MNLHQSARASERREMILDGIQKMMDREYDQRHWKDMHEHLCKR